MSKESPIKKACASRLQQELDALHEHRASGGKVAGYTCHAFPAALIAGLGMRPVRLLCGTSAETESAGEKVVRPDICPLVKTLLGSVSENRGLHADIDLWIGLFTCDQMRRGMDLLSTNLNKEVHFLQLPATRTKEAADYYADQVRRVVDDIASRQDVHFDALLARAWQEERDKAAAVLSAAARSGHVSPLDLHSMFHLYFIARPEGLAEFFTALLDRSDKFAGARTLVLSGSPLTREDTVLLEDLQKRGCAVLPLNCTGLNAVEEGEEKIDGDDLVRSLALRSFYKPTCMRSRPNTAVYDRIRSIMNTTKASGLIVKSLKYCDHWYTERERLRRSFDVPVLVFDSDYAEGGKERLLSRIDAFLETIE